MNFHGRRIWREKLGPDDATVGNIRKYVYDGANVKYEFECAADGSACMQTAEYAMKGVDGLLAVKRTQPGDDAWYFYHTDHLGSVVAVTDQIGNVVAKYSYDAWGNQTCTGSFCADNRYTYTAREWDEDAKLYYYRARWYDPKIQRFISEDPVTGEGAQDYEENEDITDMISSIIDQSMINSLYTFCGNNPVTYTDPFGDKKEKYQKPPNPNKKRTERNVKHPNGEEHSRITKKPNKQRGGPPNIKRAVAYAVGAVVAAAGAAAVVATIVEDVASLGIGVADDPLTIGTGIALINQGVSIIKQCPLPP